MSNDLIMFWLAYEFVDNNKMWGEYHTWALKNEPNTATKEALTKFARGKIIEKYKEEK